jgi:hypothetical protein
VDPKTLGSYAVILSFMSLLTVDELGHSAPRQRALAFSGASGLVLAASRLARRQFA